jgi:hypothetical protein
MSDGWQDISTAPKDGTPVRLLIVSECEWREGDPACLVTGGWHRVHSRDRVLGWLPSTVERIVDGVRIDPPKTDDILF